MPRKSGDRRSPVSRFPRPARTLGRMRRVALAAVAIGLALAGCGGDDDAAEPQRDAAAAAAAAPSYAADAERAVREVEAGRAALLDVRTDEEWDAGRAAGAEHLPLADLEAGELPEAAKDATVFVYCRTGRRAAEAVKLLEAAGYEDVVNIGGLADWERAGGARA